MTSYLQKEGFDIIGDVHGYFDELVILLKKMGYTSDNGYFKHPIRKAVFVGDFIDRGPKQLETLQLVKKMVDNKSAFAVMGNHEFNAIGWKLGLRKHNDKNMDQHRGFLDAVGSDSPRHMEWIKWFLSLPLWLELSSINVVHACWSPEHMSQLKQSGLINNCLNIDSLDNFYTKESDEFNAAEILLKGPEVSLNGILFKDAEGATRRKARIKWWKESRDIYELSIGITGAKGTEKLKGQLVPPSTPEFSKHIFKPTFIGHYWFKGSPEICSNLVACVDYSVAQKGKLVCYRYCKETVLSNDNFKYHLNLSNKTQ